MRPVVLLSLDVEEFDMPLEYGHAMDTSRQMAIGRQGLERVMPVLAAPGVVATLFTTAHFAEHHADDIRRLSERHEVASHTYYHSRFEEGDLLSSRLRLEALTGRPVGGLRMPRMRAVDPAAVSVAGYRYDASVHPTWIPGRYNNLRLPRRPFREGGLLRIPASVSPRLRIPLFWLSFKNLPYSFYRRLAFETLERDGHLSLYFHPWEFTDIRDCGVPAYTRRGCTGRLLERLQRLLGELGERADFMRMDDFARVRCAGAAADPSS